MKNPTNRFKAGLKSGGHQFGIWNSIGDPSVTEMLGNAGYDWVMIDCEHSPIEMVDALPALQALAAYPDTSAAVRVAGNDTVLIKRALDMGAQTLMVPYVESKAEAQAAVDAMRYGPRGIRGMAGMTRATRFGQIENYYTTAEEELCLIVQVETAKGMEALEEIASVDGAHAVFVGPADLSASMGYPGQFDHPDVVKTIEQAFERCKAIGMPIGLMDLDVEAAKRWIALGSNFTAVAVDQVLLSQSIHALRAEF
ncbi:MAG: HpcH/HpaI aldolase/citrate lyase family protein [Cognatishimia sp.]|nr:HpcH/HpaI aldolase/citrate lyase family protein [Cognatishimia sp.]